MTSVELLVVMAIAATIGAVALPGFARLRDAAQVHAATHDLVASLAGARGHALRSGIRTAVRIDGRTGTVAVTAGVDTLSRRMLGALYGITLRASRDSLAYDGRGMGVGAANTSVAIHRGDADDTVFVSRLGRVRH
ncbi:MAG: hypothetical protein NVS1B4_03220 [Gemmatimonadaceae bacterium]